jgi:hypothetical protein
LLEAVGSLLADVSGNDPISPVLAPQMCHAG